MKSSILLAVVLLSACGSSGGGHAPSDAAFGTRNCGLLGCVSSGYLRNKLSPSIIGRPVGDAIRIAGAPTSSYSDRSTGTDFLTWRRQQTDDDAKYSCEERLTVRSGVVQSWNFNGNC